jgi:hypothetical protein
MDHGDVTRIRNPLANSKNAKESSTSWPPETPMASRPIQDGKRSQGNKKLKRFIDSLKKASEHKKRFIKEREEVPDSTTNK